MFIKKQLLRKLSLAAVSALAFVTLHCDPMSNKDFLGSAIVESRTYLVATTAQGFIVAMNRDEGQLVKKDELLSVIDTVPLSLQKQEILAGLGELTASISSQEAQNKSIATEVAGAEREFGRTDQLEKHGSATEQQRDNLGTQLQSTQLKLMASKHLLSSLASKNKGLLISLAAIEDQLRRCYVTAPASGIVLTRYRNPGEIAAPGNPLFEIGAFDTLYADFFVPQTMLATLRPGQQVRVRVDYEDSKVKRQEKYLPASITWIGSEAEFSPKNIQTRQSRNELVFRIRVTIPNSNGMLKRGLPVEVWR